MRELLSVTTTWGAVLSFSVFAIHPDVYAQQILTERQREQLDVLKVLSDDVSMRDGALSSLTGISIEAGEADKQARIRWSINQGERSMSFAVAAPVSDDGKPTQLASLDGLADALTFSVGFTQYFAKPTDSIQAIVSAQEKICKRLNTATCDDSAVLKAGTATDHREFLVATFTERNTSFFGVEAKLGREKVEFFDPASLSSSSEHEKPYSVTVQGGVLFLRSALLMGLRYENKVAKGEKVTRCIPYEPDPNFEDCKTLRYGPPDDTDSLILSVEYRKFIGNIAMSPKVSYDSDDDVTGGELPIYFLKDKDGQFTGGIRFGYRDDEHALSTSVFVTKALSLR